MRLRHRRRRALPAVCDPFPLLDFFAYVQDLTAARRAMRTATADTRVGAVPIQRGESLLLSYPSGNRDEEVFTDPFRFDAGRDPNKHLAFGFGVHYCLGAALARMETGMTPAGEDGPPTPTSNGASSRSSPARSEPRSAPHATSTRRRSPASSCTPSPETAPRTAEPVYAGHLDAGSIGGRCVRSDGRQGRTRTRLPRLVTVSLTSPGNILYARYDLRAGGWTPTPR
jgi:Cytochrome P450